MNSLRYTLPSGGNIYVARLNTNDQGFAEELAERAGEIGAKAWGESEWMTDVIGNKVATILSLRQTHPWLGQTAKITS